MGKRSCEKCKYLGTESLLCKECIAAKDFVNYDDGTGCNEKDNYKQGFADGYNKALNDLIDNMNAKVNDQIAMANIIVEWIEKFKDRVS